MAVVAVGVLAVRQRHRVTVAGPRRLWSLGPHPSYGGSSVDEDHLAVDVIGRRRGEEKYGSIQVVHLPGPAGWLFLQDLLREFWLREQPPNLVGDHVAGANTVDLDIVRSPL